MTSRRLQTPGSGGTGVAFPDAALLGEVRRLAGIDGGVPAASLRVSVSSMRVRGRSRFIGVVAQAPERRRDLLVKQIVGPPDTMTAPNRIGLRGERRPRLAETRSLEERYRLEHASLVAVERHLGALGDSRFDAVHALGYLPEHRALVMEQHRGRAIRDLLARTTLRVPRPPRRARMRALQATRLAGAWLRQYHALPVDGFPVRHGSIGDVLGWIDDISSFLGQNMGQRRYFETLRRDLRDAAQRALPEALPLAMSHGDFAPRNVLLADDGRVASLDIAGAVLAPVFEDLAYFAASIRSPVPRIFSGGALHDRAVIGELEGALLDGYFESAPPPWAAIRVYEALVLLDKWWGTPPRLAAGALRRLALRFGAPVVDRFLRAEIDALLTEV